ncbi:MAG: alpha/beta hydrolase [Acidobacteria bacterium]|nr:alpha/beta hydrolase [Acidobacteriota bacterium]
MPETSVRAVATSDGVELHTESVGRGNAILFVHEYAGDHRSWEPQVRRFSRSHRCITYAARGYPPSQVPADPGAYSQQHAVDDAVAVLNGLGVEVADVVGISMGGFAGLHLAMQHPARVRSLVVLGTGYGARPEEAPRFRDECEAIARLIRESGMEPFARRYLSGPARVQFRNKDPRGWEQLAGQLGEHDADGAVRTMLGVQRQRPSLYALEAELSAIEAPALILAGDEDDGCLETSLWLKRTIPRSGLVVLPKSGHTLNLEEPDLVNAFIADFLGRVAAGAWGPRDPRAIPGAITGIS